MLGGAQSETYACEKVFGPDVSRESSHAGDAGSGSRHILWRLHLFHQRLAAFHLGDRLGKFAVEDILFTFITLCGVGLLVKR